MSKTLFFKHKKLFYDSKLKVWRSERIPPVVNVEEEFVLSDNSTHQPLAADQDFYDFDDNEEYSSGKLNYCVAIYYKGYHVA